MIKNFYKQEPALVNCHDGDGVISVTNLFDKLETNMQFLHYTVLPPGTAIGLHTHGDDEEFYIILEGIGEMQIEDELYPVSAGDVIKNAPFGTHGLKNVSDVEELKILVFEVKR